jgi:tRNA G18 (ribose-2'-O)-methylase SpoU
VSVDPPAGVSAEVSVGVGPHPLPWPDDPRLDPELLTHGDRRNVADRFRYWTVAAIRAHLDVRRHPFHVAAENWQRDPNLGALVRNANAFLASAVHIVGRRSWNRRGAMMTEAYQHVHHHESIQDLRAWALAARLELVGVETGPGSVRLDQAPLPRAAMLLFGEEGRGLSAEARACCTSLLRIPHWGSTRSINAGAASAVVLWEWCRRFAGPEP